MRTGPSNRTLRARVARLFGEPTWYLTRRFHPRGAVSFVMRNEESFWSEWSTPTGIHTWVHCVWSLAAYGRHVSVENIYLQRLAVRSRNRFPFLRLRQRVRPAPAHRRRVDGNIEADFVLTGVTSPGTRLQASIIVVDQLNRRYRVRHEFAWRGTEAVALHADRLVNMSQTVSIGD